MCLPRDCPFVHLCDAPRQDSYSADDLLNTARAERLPPGEGQIDLQGFLGALPKDVWIAAEAPMVTLAAQDGSKAVLQQVQTACRALMSGRTGLRPDAGAIEPRGRR